MCSAVQSTYHALYGTRMKVCSAWPTTLLSVPLSEKLPCPLHRICIRIRTYKIENTVYQYVCIRVRYMHRSILPIVYDRRTSRGRGRRAPRTWCPAPPSRAPTRARSPAPRRRRRRAPPRRPHRARRRRATSRGSCASSGRGRRRGRRRCGRAAAWRRRRLSSPRWPCNCSPPPPAHPDAASPLASWSTLQPWLAEEKRLERGAMEMDLQVGYYGSRLAVNI